jgi:hypothetical protein
MNHFHDTGSVQDRNYSGRPMVLNDNSLDDIRQKLCDTLDISNT